MHIMLWLTITPSSHRRHGQDKTRLSCLVLSVLRCEHNWRQNKTVGDRKYRNCYVQSRNAMKPNKYSLDLSTIHTTDKTVLSGLFGGVS